MSQRLAFEMAVYDPALLGGVLGPAACGRLRRAQRALNSAEGRACRSDADD